MQFPNSIKDCSNFIEDCKAHYLHYKISIDLRKLTEIDNITILLLTANIGNIFKMKLYRNKKLLPNKSIDERLEIVGFWEALCKNPPDFKIKNTHYLKITTLNDKAISNAGFHKDIINFFTQEHNIDLQYRDKLFDAVFEACANSFEHAYKESETNKKVWFLGAYDKDKNELEFVFYDTGIGIFNSLKNRHDYFGKFIDKCIKKIGKDNTLQTLCTTNLSKYKKNKSRGNGMISFKEFIDTISDVREARLEIVTENFLYSIYCNKTIKITKSIEGTLIRWAIGGEK